MVTTIVYWGYTGILRGGGRALAISGAKRFIIDRVPTKTFRTRAACHTVVVQAGSTSTETPERAPAKSTFIRDPFAKAFKPRGIRQVGLLEK